MSYVCIQGLCDAIDSIGDGQTCVSDKWMILEDTFLVFEDTVFGEFRDVHMNSVQKDQVGIWGDIIFMFLVHKEIIWVVRNSADKSTETCLSSSLSPMLRSTLPMLLKSICHVLKSYLKLSHRFQAIKAFFLYFILMCKLNFVPYNWEKCIIRSFNSPQIWIYSSRMYSHGSLHIFQYILKDHCAFSFLIYSLGNLPFV